jgi:hypothetical protein
MEERTIQETFHNEMPLFAGINYLTVCDTAAGRYSEEASEAANGIREVIRGECVVLCSA